MKQFIFPRRFMPLPLSEDLAQWFVSLLAACEGSSIVCFVCVVHLFPGGEGGAPFLFPA